MEKLIIRINLIVIAVTVYCLLFTVHYSYSYLNASTGFLVAALQVRRLTVSKAIVSAMIPDKPNTHQLSPVL
jgi:hypothetical protein